METTAADRAMPEPSTPPPTKSPAMRRLLASNWFRNPPIPPETPYWASGETERRLSCHEAVIVHVLPKCNFCDADARFDAKMAARSSWAYFCDEHFEMLGLGVLGLGKGQELILG